MPKYQNQNTGDVVEYERSSPRLEMLPNWTRLDAAPEGPQDPVVERPSTRDSKEAWQNYALTLAEGSDESGEIDSMTKAQLIDRYGEG